MFKPRTALEWLCCGLLTATLTYEIAGGARVYAEALLHALTGAAP